MKLMIIESPGKGKKLREILTKVRPGEDWRVEASVGHIRDLPASGEDETVITTGVKLNYSPVYELTDRGKDVVKKLKSALAAADEVYLATDPDREGESISWHLQQALKLKDPKRITFNEITETAVKSAFSEVRTIDMKLVGAQEARRVLDRLVGYLVSTELRRQTGEKLSAGRVQSVAVYIVVLREREIKAFKVTNHFGAKLVIEAGNPAEWMVQWDTKAGFISEQAPYFMDIAFAERVAAIKDLVVDSYEESDASRNPPAPFNTSTVQQAASNALRWDPKKTMKVAQELYEQGHISYHRTDNPNVSDDAMPAIREAAEKLGLAVVDKRRKFKAKDGAQEGHPGITPTHWELDEAGETSEQQELYKLIRVRALASQLLPAIYAERKVTLKAVEALDGKEIKFKAKSRVLTDSGWLKLLAGDATDDDAENEKANPIPKMTVGENVKAGEGAVLELKTKAPGRYTKAGLVKALESEGIGRPATYAAIMDNIEARSYVGEEKRQLRPLPAGEQVIQRLEDSFSFLDIGFTRSMEEDLDRIAEGKTTYIPVIKSLHEVLDAELKSAQANVPTVARTRPEKPEYTCPKCNKNKLRRVKGSAGYFWSCTGYHDGSCSASFKDKGQKPVLTEKAKPAVTVSTEHKCAAAGCGKALIKRPSAKNKGKFWWACSGYPDCKQTYFDKAGAPNYESENKE